MPFSLPAQTKPMIAATPIANRLSPFVPGSQSLLESAAGSTVYGVKHPGSADTAKYARFVQSISGNKAFKLPSGITTANILQTTGGAVSDANQLRAVVLVDGVISMMARADQVAAAGKFVIGAGGGTAVADATLSIKGTTAAALLAGSTQMSIASSGADTQTIQVGDLLSIAGDSTQYRCTETSQALNGTTEVLVDITPPLQAACLAAAVVTVATSDDRTVLMGTAPRVGAIVEVFIFASTDIATVTGGALTAATQYADIVYDFMVATALTNLKGMPHVA